MALGGILGMERGRKHRPAGMRTYMIVCMASALVMITGEYIYSLYGIGDPARLGAQVISGIGFLGAGTIIVTSRQVKGLTTAAGLWACACMGLAVGAGFYTGGVICGLLILLVQTVVHHIDRYFSLHSKNLFFFAEFKSMEYLGAFIDRMREADLRLHDIEINKSRETVADFVGATFWIQTPGPCNHVEMIHMLSCQKGVKYLEELDYM